MRVVRLVLIAVLAATSACGDAGDEPAGDDPAVTADGSAPRSLTELLDEPAAAGDVVVSTVLLDDGSGIRMCEALAESFPPQCGGRSLLVVDDPLTGVDWTEHEGVRWTDRPVELRGRMVGETFVVS